MYFGAKTDQVIRCLLLIPVFIIVQIKFPRKKPMHPFIHFTFPSTWPVHSMIKSPAHVFKVNKTPEISHWYSSKPINAEGIIRD